MLNLRFGLSRLFAAEAPMPAATATRPGPLTLPADVRAAICGATIQLRPARPKDAPEVIVCVGLHNAICYTGDRFAEFVRKLFPELSDEQVAMAVTRMDYRVRYAIMEADERT